MENFFNSLQQMGPVIYIVPVFIIFGIGISIYVNIWARKKTSEVQSWYETHPDAAKIYLKGKSGLLRNDSLNVHSVDGEEPRVAFEGNVSVIYVEPGTRVLEASFSTTKPGVVHKTVTENYGPGKIEIEIKAYKSYRLWFDIKEAQFTFEEDTEQA